MIDERVGSAELEQLAEVLAPPSRLGDYALEGLIRKTSTALIFIAVGGVFGAGEGVIKLTGKQYAPLLERELCLLNQCREADINGVVRPAQTSIEWLDIAELPGDSAAAMLLPFLSGGDLVQLIGSRATRTGRLGARLALDVGERVGGVLRALLHLPRPLVHRDVKPQNLLLPYPGAPLSELTLIDFDISDELDIPLEDFGSAPKEVARQLAEDVHGFGELLYVVATGREPPTDRLPDPHSGNSEFDALVIKCLTSEAYGAGYVCVADNGLWHDLEKALAAEKRRKERDRSAWGVVRYLLQRRSLAGLGVVLFVALLVALGSKVFI